MIKVTFKEPQGIFYKQLSNEVLVNDATLVVINKVQIVLLNIPYVKWHYPVELSKIGKLKYQ